MTFYQGLATVLFKVFAATLIVRAVVTMASFAGAIIGSPAESQYVAQWLVPTGFAVIAGLLIWICAEKLGNWVARSVKAQEPSLKLSAEEMIAIGVFLIGVFYVVESGPQTLAETVRVFIEDAARSAEERAQGDALSGFDIARLAGGWFTVIAALILVFQARGAARFFAWLRQAGLSSAASERS